MLVTLFQGRTSAVAAPTASTDGVPLWKGQNPGTALGQFLNPGEGFFKGFGGEVALLIYNTAGSGAMSIPYARLWGGFWTGAGSLLWIPMGTGTDADKGKLNEGAAIGLSSGKLYHQERVRGIDECIRMALETGTFSGTPTLRAELLVSG